MSSTSTDYRLSKHETGKLLPYRGRILAEPIEPETQTRGGILIPETAQKEGVEYIIRAIGPGHMNDDGEHLPIYDLKVGQHIVINKYTGVEIGWHNGKETVSCRVLDSDQIIAFFDD